MATFSKLLITIFYFFFSVLLSDLKGLCLFLTSLFETDTGTSNRPLNLVNVKCKLLSTGFLKISWVTMNSLDCVCWDDKCEQVLLKIRIKNLFNKSWKIMGFFLSHLCIRIWLALEYIATSANSDHYLWYGQIPYIACQLVIFHFRYLHVH